ncbi:hypothetical protein E2C01_072046 [Portunus trituberculatus]|uniref:Uncharacterized protein n=1 Tax=Portunus trituberculatus TaxID=210409 RepID=A0A5B7I6R3_PORTR|nr:hypothetical protein [Portunus trituberculatus]
MKTFISLYFCCSKVSLCSSSSRSSSSSSSVPGTPKSSTKQTRVAVYEYLIFASNVLLKCAAGRPWTEGATDDELH